MSHIHDRVFKSYFIELVIRVEKGWKKEAERGQKWIEHDRSNWWFVLCGMWSQMAGYGTAFCQNKAIIYCTLLVEQRWSRVGIGDGIEINYPK